MESFNFTYVNKWLNDGEEDDVAIFAIVERKMTTPDNARPLAANKKLFRARSIMEFRRANDR